MILGKKLVEKTSVNEQGDFVTENVWDSEDVVTAPSEAKSSTPLTCEPKKKRVKTTASRKTQAPAHLQRPAEPSRDEPPTVVPTAGDRGDRDDDTVGYEDEAPPRAAPSLLASFDAAAASSSEDEEEEETTGQRPKSQYRGVSASGSSRNPWRTTLKVDGKPVKLGSHATEEEAARVYDKYILEHNLVGTPRRKLNFPLPGEEEAARRAKKPLSRPGPSTKPSVTEQLATTRSERDAVRLERDMLRAGRETVASERDALRAERDALRSERDAACSDRDTLRSERDAACSDRDTLRSERDVLQIQLTCMTSFKDQLLAKLAPA
ncbi:hypothetical protein SO694_00060114 [Aureococcus anophagefferens]|uniref:AP2/ERF domain-containing protein n=1 Tax=Aureococcus anophagefferens TaxID=44056 RepID=A0ABR1FR21_AURAN